MQHSNPPSDHAMQTTTDLPFDQHTPDGGIPSIDGFNFNFNTPGTSGQMSEENELSPLTKSFPESFSSPFVPQSLWNLNQTFEWDLANFGIMNGNTDGGIGLGEG